MSGVEDATCYIYLASFNNRVLEGHCCTRVVVFDSTAMLRGMFLVGLKAEIGQQ